SRTGRTASSWWSRRPRRSGPPPPPGCRGRRTARSPRPADARRPGSAVVGAWCSPSVLRCASVHCEYTDRYGYMRCMERLRGAEVLAGATLVVMWSSGFVGAELGTRHAPADTLLAWRYLVAAAVLLAVLAYRRARPHRGAVARQAAVGLLCQVG